MHIRNLTIPLSILLLAAALPACDSDSDDEPDVTDAVDVVETSDGAGDADAAPDVDAPADEAPGDGADATDTAPEVTVQAPICEGGGGSVTRRSWVHPVSGFTYCDDVNCSDCDPVCQEDGTADEGWYAVCSTSVEAGCGELPGLIVRMNCM